MQNYYNSENEIGIDEAGRGPLIGRVYAGAVIWSSDKQNDLIKDSKKLTPKKRKIALEWIKQNVKAWGVGYAEPQEIDTINILEATKLAMTRAIQNLKDTFNLNNDIKDLIIDGVGWENKFKDFNVTSIIKGDDKYYSIAAASIIAKEYHDMHINELCDNDPDLESKYGLRTNMGYGTKKHIEAIDLYGRTIHHRQSFKIKSID